LTPRPSPVRGRGEPVGQDAIRIRCAERLAVSTFRALVVDKAGDGVSLDLKEWSADRLMAGEVTIRVEYSSINYKDGLAVRADGRVVRSYPLIPGIDLAGEVIESSN